MGGVQAEAVTFIDYGGSRGCMTVLTASLRPYSSRPFNNFVRTKRTFYRLKHCFNIAFLFVSTAS